MSPLHEAVLFDSLESVRKWTSRLKKDERNAFGQTPLHLAISKSDYLRILIDAGYDLDAGDNYGITPLMYAAATNQEEAVMMLIEADSDLNATDFKWNRNFMFYAGLRQHWNLILQVLNTIESHVGKHAAERWAQFATYLFLVIFPDRLEISGVSLNQLLAKCGTVNFIYNAGDDKRNRCLLHDIRSPAEFDALLANGFRLVNHADSAGQHPVMAAADRCESGLVNRLLAYGTDINRKDNFHKTSLYYVLRRLEREQSYLFQNVSVKALHDENIEEIIDEESAFIEDLESEMDQSARKEYNALLNDWIVQIKTSLDTACIRAAKQGEEYNVLRPNCKVDHHHDTFVYEIETCGWRDPKREVTSQISEPRCPQVAVDVGHLLRIPPDHTFPDEPEDEFRCTNLDVMLPDRGPDVINSNLPVLVWIHGGSQAVTFGSAASGVCDMSKIVADSMRLGKPIIAVSVQYRLNVFALGNGEGPPNLALRDQELALEWVQEHIAGFGGDPDMVTLAGESAGAIYCHAHLVANARVRQVILSSGSLFLSPPQPWHLVASFRDKVSTNLKDMDQTLDLETASVSEVVEAVRRSGLQSFFLEWEDPFNAWHTKTGCAERLLLSDVTKEGAIYQAGVWATEPSDIAKAFDASEQYGDELKKLYHIYPGRPSSCKTGALDFINDYKYLLPVQRLEKSFKDARKPVFRCLIDEANPWQPSSGAHHAVDLVLLFGGFDLSFSPSAERVGQAMREAWVKFISGEEPWPEATEKYYGFGPHGSLKTLEDWEVQSRRRIGLAEKLSEMESPFLDKTSRGLAAGKVSLLN
ncbi:Lipase 3 [Fusarium oxysporum f. sp. conglutinans]|nr:Lipase 3 [Fusarium oxysporum f. sp. conglutinans]